MRRFTPYETHGKVRIKIYRTTAYGGGYHYVVAGEQKTEHGVRVISREFNTLKEANNYKQAAIEIGNQ